MTYQFSAEVWYWKGPAPHYFVSVPPDLTAEIKEMEKAATYGWGMIPVNARVGETEWYTAMWPRDGAYVLPLKLVVRRAERLEEGDTVEVMIEVITSR